MRNSLLLRASFVLLGMGCMLPAFSQFTFTQDIAPIIYNHCTQCHREGEIGPMPLTNYQEVSQYGALIAFATSSGHMPPWSPDPEYTTFVGQNVLTDEEIEKIHQWVLTGMVEGDPELEPDLPVFPEGSQIGEPDLVITMDQAYFHEGDWTDQYQVFVLPVELDQDQDIRAIEVRPGNNSIAHHAILALDTTSTGVTLDEGDPDYGYESFGGFGFDPMNPFLTAWVPGTSPQIFPDGIGTRLIADSKILLQMHYGPTGDDQTDQTSLNVFFAEEPVSRYAVTLPMSPMDLDEAFIIPPNTVKTFHGTLEVPIDISLMGIAPHAHLLGKSWEVYATGPGNDTIPLIRIPQWDFHHQGFYTYPNLLKIPAGYTVHCFGTYDNTVNNPNNPNNPPIWVSWGEGTEDEMYLCYFTIIPYWEGDENISLEPEETTGIVEGPESRLFLPWPNPAKEQVQVGIGLHLPSRISIELIDQQGKLVKSFFTNRYTGFGHHVESLSISGIAPGSYYLRMSEESGRTSAKPLIIE